MEEKANSDQPIEPSEEQDAESAETKETPSLAIRLRTTNEIRSESLKQILIGLGILALGGVAVYLPTLLRSVWEDGATCLLIVGYIFALGALFTGGGTAFNGIRSFLRTVMQFLNYRKVDCPTCGHRPKVSIRWFNYFCQQCGVEQTLNLEQFDLPKRQVQEGTKCSSCESPIQLIGRPAWFTCPKCKSRVDLETLPEKWYE